MSHLLATRFPKHWDLHLGKTWAVTKEMTTEDTIAYAKLSRDFNALHLSEELCGETRFKKTMVHGMHTASLFSAVLANLTPWCIYKKQEIEWKAPVYHGDRITVSGEIEDIDIENGNVKVKLLCKNQHDEIVATGTSYVKKLKEIYDRGDKK